MDAKLIHGEIPEPDLQGGRAFLHLVIPSGGIYKHRVADEGMSVTLVARESGAVTFGRGEKIIIDLLAPFAGRHDGRAVWAHHNIVSKDVAAVRKPHMRVERVVHDNVFEPLHMSRADLEAV